MSARVVLLALTAFAAPGYAADISAAPEQAALEREMTGVVAPFLKTYCTSCHGADKPKGDLNLTAYRDLAAVVRDHRRWQSVIDVLEAREMPPEKAKAQPSDQARAAIVAFVKNVKRHEARTRAGDPGEVLARRLSNAEYDYTVRDLTGVDLRPTREFPVDPANEAGFDNSGESLAMSPALFKKYLDAAREVAEHVALLPEGLTFAPHPVVTETDRDRFAVRRIVDFYEAQTTDFARYFYGAWRAEQTTGPLPQRLDAVAREENLSRNYLGLVHATLTGPDATVGPLAKLRADWQALPRLDPGAAPRARWQTDMAARKATEQMRDFVVRVREQVAPFVPNLRLKAVGAGSQPFILHKNRKMAEQRQTCDLDQLYPSGGHPAGVTRTLAMLQPLAAGFEALQALGAIDIDARTLLLRMSDAYARVASDPDLAVPPEPAARKQHEAAWKKFCQVFPDAFYVSERGRIHMDRSRDKQDKGRLLSAGGHNMFGYFRDDIPLYQMLLEPAQRRQLDRLWRDLELLTNAPKRQHADFIFYERAEGPRTIKGPEFDFVRSEDKASTSTAMIRRLAKVYIDKARQSLRDNGGDAVSIPVLEGYFKDVDRNLRRFERDEVSAQPTHLAALVDFAARAYRRPLRPQERDELLAFYRSLRKDLDHADAVRDTLASVLVSPHFLYRVDLVPPGKPLRPLPQYALASRLSYFLWSSMPDAQLLQVAARKQLDRPEVLLAQTRRMLADPRARALAVEFAGNWLEFRRFEEHNSVDRERFPSFTSELRQAMFEEPVRFFLDMVRRDRPVTDLVFARDTFVNPVLAKHYGIEVEAATPDTWVHVPDAEAYGRGGILPMAVFLTKNAPGLRTSPVKRGYWVVRRALGEYIPPPPAEVPDLPNDERKMGNLTLREVLAKHRENKACAACHARFDSFGLAFEGYGPVGERRTNDLGGRPVDTRAAFPLGHNRPGEMQGEGVGGLRAYLAAHRQDDFLDNLSRKMLSYALGRGLLLSDDPTIEELRGKLASNQNRFSVLVESIVQSKQFLTKRIGADLAQGSN